MFFHLPSLVVIHHSSAGVGEGDLLFLAPTKTTAGQKQKKILAGLTKDLILLSYTFFSLILLLLLYSKPDVCASLTTSRLFGLGDLPRSVSEHSSDHYLLKDMGLGHVSLLPLCMLLLMSRKPYFLER